MQLMGFYCLPTMPRMPPIFVCRKLPGMEEPKRPRGRPPAPPGTGLTKRHTLRVSEALKAKLRQLGDDWARRVLERAKPPKDSGRS